MTFKWCIHIVTVTANWHWSCGDILVRTKVCCDTTERKTTGERNSKKLKVWAERGTIGSKTITTATNFNNFMTLCFHGMLLLFVFFLQQILLKYFMLHEVFLWLKLHLAIMYFHDSSHDLHFQALNLHHQQCKFCAIKGQQVHRLQTSLRHLKS